MKELCMCKSNTQKSEMCKMCLFLSYNNSTNNIGSDQNNLQIYTSKIIVTMVQQIHVL